MTPPTRAEIDRFRALVEKRLGLAVEDARLSVLGETLKQRAMRTCCRSATQYMESCLHGSACPDELEALAERLTISETYFFRNRDHFRVLTDVAVPSLLLARGGRAPRILSAGCSSGEEPYSVAISLREAMPELFTSGSCIVGVDINPAVLAKAAAARYTQWSLRETPDELRERYFVAEGDRMFRLDENIRRMVMFEKHNLNATHAPSSLRGEFDIIFCRNVIMYFSLEAAERLIARFTELLAPGGFLFLGTAETLRGLSQAFRLKHSHETFYYRLRREQADETRKVRPTAGALQLADFGALDAAVASSSLPERSTASASWIVMVEQAAHSIEVLERSAAATSSAQVGRAGACAASMLVQARWLAQSERFVDALDVLSALPAEAARDSDTLLFRAILLTNQGQAAEAESICRQLLAQDELNAGAHYLMALCREHAGDREGAADHDQYALYLDPSLAMPRLHLGLMARRAGDRVAARRELGEALFLLTREDTPRILLLGGGFSRETLIALCRAELFACGGVR